MSAWVVRSHRRLCTDCTHNVCVFGVYWNARPYLENSEIRPRSTVRARTYVYSLVSRLIRHLLHLDCSAQFLDNSSTYRAYHRRRIPPLNTWRERVSYKQLIPPPRYYPVIKLRCYRFVRPKTTTNTTTKKSTLYLHYTFLGSHLKPVTITLVGITIFNYFFFLFDKNLDGKIRTIRLLLESIKRILTHQ